MVKDLIVDISDLKQVREDILESAFNMNVGLVTFEGDKPIYYVAESVSKIVDAIIHALQKPSSSVTYSDVMKEIYCEKMAQVDQSATKYMQSRNKNLNSKMFFLSVYEKMLRIWGDFL